MSVEVPQSMEDVAMQLAQHQIRGEHVTEEEVIKNAVRDIFQAYFDDALEGRYNEVNWDGQDLCVTDVMGESLGTVQPVSDSFVKDFKQDPDALMDRLADITAKMVGGR